MATATTVTSKELKKLSASEKLAKTTQGAMVKALDSGKAGFEAWVNHIVAVRDKLNEPGYRAKGNTAEPTFENNVTAMIDTHVRGNIIKL